MQDITDAWNTECELTQRVLSTANIIDLGIGENIFLVETKTDVGRSEHYYVQNKKPTLVNTFDKHGGLIEQVRKHQLEAAYYQAEVAAPQGTNVKTSTLKATSSHLGQQIKQKVEWTHRFTS